MRDIFEVSMHAVLPEASTLLDSTCPVGSRASPPPSDGTPLASRLRPVSPSKRVAARLTGGGLVSHSFSVSLPPLYAYSLQRLCRTPARSRLVTSKLRDGAGHLPQRAPSRRWTSRTMRRTPRSPSARAGDTGHQACGLGSRSTHVVRERRADAVRERA